jgi:hypothetical protein
MKQKYAQWIIEGRSARASLGLPLMHSFIHQTEMQPELTKQYTVEPHYNSQ